MINILLRRGAALALLIGAVAIQGCGSGGAEDAGSAVIYATCPDGSKVKGSPSNCPGGSTTTPTTTTPTTTTPEPQPVDGVGLPAIEDNFDTSAGIYASGRAIPPRSADPNGSFRMLCLPGQLLYEDPVVYPGALSPHLHQFFGNVGANRKSNYKSLRESGQSTCQNDKAAPVNRSAYWIPAMLNGIGGVVKPDYWHIYYKRVPKGHPACTAAGGDCVPIPNGLRFIFGYDMTTMRSGVLDEAADFYWMSRWQCYSGDLQTIRADGWEYRTLQSLMDSGLCRVGDVARLNLNAPSCWDGKNVDSPNHRSHLAVARTSRPGFDEFTCPNSHPYVITGLGGFIDWTIDQEFVERRWLFSSDEQMRQMGHDVVAGETFHFDYIEAWSPLVKAAWENNCLNGRLSCNVGELGDGTQMRDGPSPRPTHQVVPVPSRPAS